MPITFITLKMMFVITWTINDGNSLSCQSLYQAQFVCSMYNIVIKSLFISIIKCGTDEKVDMEPPWSFNFMFLPFITLRSSVSIIFLFIYGVILETKGMLKL
jgi:hypothetical protein